MINLDTFVKQSGNCAIAAALQLLRRDPPAATYEYGFIFGFLMAASAYYKLTREELNALCYELDSIYTDPSAWKD